MGLAKASDGLTTSCLFQLDGVSGFEEQATAASGAESLFSAAGLRKLLNNEEFSEKSFLLDFERYTMTSR